MNQIQCPIKPREPEKYKRVSIDRVVDSYAEIEIPDGVKSFSVSANVDYDRSIESYDITFYKEYEENPTYEEELKIYKEKIPLYEINLKLYQDYETEKKRQTEECLRKFDENEFERLRIKLGK